ncbi:MAG: DoxX family protein [Devosiaceae bacterium]|nr:DoxX family protein [Devosiaceae bacterium]
MSEMTREKSGRNWLSIALWAVQIFLAIGYAIAGMMKIVSPISDLALEMAYAADVPEWFVRTVGVLEIAGAVGIILPALMKVMTWLVPLTAICFSLVQVTAIFIHANYGETAQFLAINLILLAMSLFVLWGRWKKLPHQSR